MNAKTSTSPIPAQPAHEVRVGGIKAAIWLNETGAGPRYNVTFERLYREGEQWRSTSSFGRDDLLTLSKVADLAHTWICVPSDKADGKSGPKTRRTTLDGGLRLPER